MVFTNSLSSYYEKMLATGEVKCIDEEIPFEIPQGWEWERFGNVMINKDSERVPLSVAQRQHLKKTYDYYGASGVIDKVDKYLFDKDLLLIGEDVSRPEKGLQKRVNLMQQTTNSDLSRHYLPRQLRHLILQEYLSGVKTARQLSEEHGIPMSTIHKMGQRWKAKNSCSFVSTPNPYPIMSRVTSEEASELLSENKALRRRLEEALLRLEGYEIMGDILQEEYGIDLLKKSAAGQSSVSKKDTQQ